MCRINDFHLQKSRKYNKSRKHTTLHDGAIAYNTSNVYKAFNHTERERERDVYMSRSIESDGHHNFDVRVYIDHETWPNFFASVDNQDIRATGRVEGFSKA